MVMEVPDELEASAQESGSDHIVDEERSRVRLQNTLPSKQLKGTILKILKSVL
jgi:hypothetical protein